MEKIYEAFVESTIVMGVLVVMFGGTICYMYATQKPVPAELLTLEGTLAGFWLRSKASVEVRKNIASEQA